MRNKIKKLINDTNSVEKKISITDNNITNLFKQDGQILKNKLIYEGEIQTDTPTALTTYSTIQNIEAPASTVNYISSSIELELPTHLIPFIDVETIYQSTPNNNVKAGIAYQSTRWTADRIEIRGNSNLLYKGRPNTIASDRVLFTEDTLIDNFIPTANTKNVLGGTLLTPVTHLTVNSTYIITECVKTINYTYTDDPDPDIHGEHDSKVAMEVYTVSHTKGGCNFTSSSYPTITGKWAKDIYLFEYTGSLGSVDNYDTVYSETVYVDLTLTPDTWYWYGRYDGVVTTFFAEAELGSVLILAQIGYYAYYSSRTEKFIRTELVAGGDGSFSKYRLTNFPSVSLQYPTLSYSSITFKRNEGSFPKESDLTSTTVVYHTQETHSSIRYQENEDSQKNSIVIIELELQYILTAPATEKQTWSIPEYDDVYSSNATTYTLTSETHSLKERYTYYAIADGVKYQHLVYLKNPFYYQERKMLQK